MFKFIYNILFIAALGISNVGFAMNEKEKEDPSNNMQLDIETRVSALEDRFDKLLRMTSTMQKSLDHINNTIEDEEEDESEGANPNLVTNNQNNITNQINNEAKSLLDKIDQYSGLTIATCLIFYIGFIIYEHFTKKTKKKSKKHDDLWQDSNGLHFRNHGNIEN